MNLRNLAEGVEVPDRVEGAGRRLLDVLNALQNVALWKTMTIHNDLLT